MHVLVGDKHRGQRQFGGASRSGTACEPDDPVVGRRGVVQRAPRYGGVAPPQHLLARTDGAGDRLRREVARRARRHGLEGTDDATGVRRAGMTLPGCSGMRGADDANGMQRAGMTLPGCSGMRGAVDDATRVRWYRRHGIKGIKTGRFSAAL